MRIWTATAVQPGVASEVDAFVQVLAREKGMECRRLRSREHLVEALQEDAPDVIVLHHHFYSEGTYSDPWEVVRRIPPHVRIVYLAYEDDLAAVEAPLRQHAIRSWIIGPVDPESLTRKIVGAADEAEPELLLNRVPSHLSRPMAPTVIREVERVVETRVIPQKIVSVWCPGQFDTASLAGHLAAYLGLDPQLSVIAADLDPFTPSLATVLGIAQHRDDPSQLCCSRILEQGISEESVRRHLVELSGQRNLRVFPGFWDPQIGRQIPLTHGVELINCLRDLSHIVILSAGCGWSPLAEAAVRRSHQVLIPVGPGYREELHLMRYMLYLSEAGIPKERFTLVPWGKVSREEIADRVDLATTEPIQCVRPEWEEEELLEALRRPILSGPMRPYIRGVQKVADHIYSNVRVQKNSGIRRWFTRVIRGE